MQLRRSFCSAAGCALILLFNESRRYVVDFDMNFVTETRAATRWIIPQHESVVHRQPEVIRL